MPDFFVSLEACDFTFAKAQDVAAPLVTTIHPR
jgi:hypothetical protein